MTNKLGSGKDGRGDRFFSNGNPQHHLLAGINRATAYDSVVIIGNRNQAMSISQFPQKSDRDLWWQKHFCKELTNTDWVKACPHFQHWALIVSQDLSILHTHHTDRHSKFRAWSNSLPKPMGNPLPLMGWGIRGPSWVSPLVLRLLQAQDVTHTIWRLRTVTFFKNATLPTRPRLQTFQRVSF